MMSVRYYLAAVCAAGVHLEAAAAVVYTEINGFPYEFGNLERPFTYVQNLDLDGDGAYDYYFGGGGQSFPLIPAGDNRMLSTRVPLPDLERNIVALEPGAVIGAMNVVGEWTGLVDAANDFDNGGSILFSIYTVGTISNIPMSETTFLGLEFHMESSVHYGWVSLRSGLSTTNFVYIYGWAYESEPSKPILAGAIPEPSASLLMLIAWMGWLNRRREELF